MYKYSKNFGYNVEFYRKFKTIIQIAGLMTTILRFGHCPRQLLSPSCRQMNNIFGLIRNQYEAIVVRILFQLIFNAIKHIDLQTISTALP